MKFEFSAGGVVVKKVEAKTEILLCQHSQHHGWVFPKGLIDDHRKGEKKSASANGFGLRPDEVGETKEEAALREVKEECGVDGKIVQALMPITYWYQWEGEKRKKTVYYFLMDFVGGDISKHDDEMENVEWLPVDAVATRLTYPSDKKVWEEARALLSKEPSL